MKLIQLISLFGVLIYSLCAKDRPNVIVVLVDDMGYSDLGSFGGEVRTPNIDLLAGEGLRFTQNYNSARCCPSRASLLTGLYSHQAGIANFTGGDKSDRFGPAYLGKLNKNCVTLAEVLKQAGYATYGVGKWHVGHEALPTDRGFDEYYGYVRGHSASQWNPKNNQRLPEGREKEFSYEDGKYYATDVFSDYAVEFIKQAESKESPFFLYLAHSSPHFPLEAPAETRDSYLKIYREGWDKLREKRYQRQKEIGLITDAWKFTGLSEVPSDRDDIANHYAGKQNPKWKNLPDDRKEDLVYRMATFAAMIEHVDRGIGRIIAKLKEQGKLQNTLILFTSDNGACYEWGPFGFDRSSRQGFTKLHQGEDLGKVGGPGTYHSVGSGWSCLSNTPLRMYKHFNHEGGNCSPLIAHWPDGIRKPDQWVRSPVHLIDFMPTILEATDARYPNTFDGEKIHTLEGFSMMPFFQGSQEAKPRTLFFDHFDSSAIRKGDWKLVRGNTRYNDRKWELYNLAKDRCETVDLIESKPELTNKLKEEWLSWAIRMKINPYYEFVEKNPTRPLTKIPKNKKGYFLLRHGDQVDRAHAPDFTQKAFEIIVSMKRGKEKDGVLVSHGGINSGYSLYLDAGRIAFACRNEGDLKKIISKKVLPSEEITVTAKLTNDGHAQVFLDNQLLVQSGSFELIKTFPQDPLEVGNDSLSTVSDYQRRTKFKGEISKVLLKIN
jgi:arylsulfatase